VLAWVRIPFLSHTSDTVIYVFYGDSAITTVQSTASSVWDANFVGVWHFSSAGSPDVHDSTVSGANGTNNSTTSGSGQIDGAASLTGANGQRISVPNSASWNFGSANFTVEWWEKRTSLQNPGNYVIARDGTTNTVPFIFGAAFNGGSTNNVFMSSNGSSWDIGGGQSMGTIDLNQWNHFAIRRSGNNFYTYKNGSQTNTFTSSLGLNWNNNPLSIGYGQNSSYVFAGSLDEVRISHAARSPDWISTEYANQLSPATFLAMGSEAYLGGVGAGSFTTTNTIVPSNAGTLQLNLTGSGTSWSGGTVFSVSGVPGVSVVSQSIASPVSAALTISTGNFTGLLSVSDGTVSTGLTVTSPGLAATWSGPWRYNDAHPGSLSNGDTWLMMPTVNGIRVTCNDCNGIASSNSSNVAFFAESSDLTSVTFINGLTGLGGFAGANVGMCSNGRTVKSSSPISYNGWYLLPVRCQGQSGAVDNHGTLLFSTSGDDGAHWWRAQDSYPVSAGNWSAGVATLTTAAQSLAVGDLIVVSGCNPAAYNTLPGAVATVTGTDATHVTYTLGSNPGAYVSGCVVLGPGTASGSPAGNGWSAAMFETGMVRPFFAQYNTDNTPCCAGIDQNDLYLNGISLDGAASNPIVFRVLKSDFDLAPGDSTKYQYWTGVGSSYSPNPATAASPQCVVDGVSTACSAMGAACWEGVSYIQDVALPDGGQYFTISGCTGQQTIWTASHIYGPWTLVSGTSIIDDAYNPPVQYGFGNVIPQLYTSISSNPYRATIRVQSDGQWTSDYSIFHHDVTLSLKSPNASRLFNSASTPGVAGNGSQYRHISSGLVALWRMQTTGDPSLGGTMTSPIKDESAARADINVANANCNPSMMTSVHGLENTNPAFNATWRTCGGAWAVPTGWGMDLADFSVLFVGKSDLTGTQVAMAGPMSTTGTGFGWHVSGGAMKISIRGGATVDFACPPPSANVFFAYLAVRKGGATYCFKSNAAAATSAGTDSATLGASWNLRLGSASDQTTNYWRGTIGEIGIWSRALCSREIAGSCHPGQVDEVQREFQTVRTESGSRGWGIQ
jgi:hypothetical protein